MSWIPTKKVWHAELITCPICGSEEAAPTEYADQDSFTCEKCGAEVEVNREVSITYTTEVSQVYYDNLYSGR